MTNQDSTTYGRSFSYSQRDRTAAPWGDFDRAAQNVHLLASLMGLAR